MYIPFGTVKGTLHKGDIAACLGYIVQDGTTMEDERICLLKEDPKSDFLVSVSSEALWSSQYFTAQSTPPEKRFPSRRL